MNTPFDAHLNKLVEEADSQGKTSVEEYTANISVQQANRPADETENTLRGAGEEIVVPNLKNGLTENQPAPVFEPEEASKQCQEQVIKKLLVVDDLPVNRKLIGIQLQKLGFEVDQAENGLQALEKVKEEEYGIVFMDLEMPEMDGYQTAIEIRQLDLENRVHTPIVGLTSYSRLTEKQRCISSGMDDLISKGISGRKLQEMVARHVRKRVVQPPAPEAPARTDAGVEIDIQLLHDTHGKIEEVIVDLSLGAMKTFIGCLKCALEDRDMQSIKHFVGSIKGPCTTLGLKSTNKLAVRIQADAAKEDWTAASQGMTLLESQYSQILDQLTGLSATLHRVDET